MSSVYLVNVGANTSHKTRARSPIFENGSWVYVSFPTAKAHRVGYSPDAIPFLRGVDPDCTHADPRWGDLTYGDNCANPRAGALKKVTRGDILLFWGLLWANRGSDWSTFSGERGWYLFGAFRVEEIALPGWSLEEVSKPNRERARGNPHFKKPDFRLRPDHRVFLGADRYSKRFDKAVDLEVSKPSGLVYRAFATAKGQPLALDEKPLWQSSLRSCREIWDLSERVGRARAEIVRKAIAEHSGFDLLEDL